MGANLVLKLLSSCKRLPVANRRSPRIIDHSTFQSYRTLINNCFIS